MTKWKRVHHTDIVEKLHTCSFSTTLCSIFWKIMFSRHIANIDACPTCFSGSAMSEFLGDNDSLDLGHRPHRSYV